MPIWAIVVLAIVGPIGLGLIVMAISDLFQKQHAIMRNFPVVGHMRFWMEAIGPEVRQYIVTSNAEERPFSRDQRRWVYASAKRQNNYFGFGTEKDLESASNYLIIKHAAFPLPDRHPDDPHHDPRYRLPGAKVLGGPRGRKHAFRPASVVNVSGMSFGALSAHAVEAMNKGARIANILHNTGEGGLAPHHQHGADLVFQIGTGYFGCRDANGRFSMDRLKTLVAANPVRAIEIKLSQGAKPGRGGLLPAAKVTPEIAAIRSIPVGRDCVSPSSHSAFQDVDGLLDFVEAIAEETGLPVGIKSAVGESGFWQELAHRMAVSGRGVDFITIDGGEGGTGAAPLVFTDHVALPYKVGMARVYRIFAEAGMHQQVTFIGSGKLGLPDNALFAFALGADMINVGREAMLAVGCIQAQRCHTGHCPTGVATQSPWLQRGLVPDLKAERLAHYVTELRKELLALSHACGAEHPALITSDHLEVLDGRFGHTTLVDLFGYHPGWSRPSAADCAAIQAIMRGGPAGMSRDLAGAAAG